MHLAHLGQHAAWIVVPHEVDEELHCKGTVHDEAWAAFHFFRPVRVIVNAMAIECDR